MSLIFRMLAIYFASYFKPRLPVEKPVNSLSLRVLPNDLDINLHMNNGRYLTICDLTRVDMFIRTGLAKTMLKKNWLPIISEHSMVYKKPLRVWQRYEVKMAVTGWDDRSFKMHHQFIRNGRLIAEGYSTGVIVAKSGVIAPLKVMQTVQQRLEENIRPHS